jgi:phosphatidyl-myo-inositol dimannoside synthase
MDKSRYFLGSTLMTAGHGGIARVARITARVLIENGNPLSMLSLLDKSPVEIEGQEVKSAHGNRLSYVAQCHAAALSPQTFIYDSVGMARAHPRLPGLRRPYIVWMHGIEVWGNLSAERLRILHGAEKVFVNSQYTLNRFQEKHGPLNNARLCWLATEGDNAPLIRPTFAGPPTVLIIARIDCEQMYKGHKELVKCWANVTSVIPDARLVIVGGGSGCIKIEETAKSSPAFSNIDIMGFVSEDDLDALWEKAHVFAMPSRGEGFGLVYIEAMRHGLPVIASIHDAGQEVNVDGVTGYNVDLNKPGQLAERIIHLLENPEVARLMGQAGHERWQKNFRYSEFRHRFLKSLSL